MLARSRRYQRRRRGIVLVLILAMLGLMAVIGFTFATFSGQSRISARNFAQSVIQPQRDELMDYALAQLISDTADVRSAIRGHSLARDMYGNDAFRNGYLTQRPDGAYMAPNNDPLFYLTSIAPAGGTLYDVTTNIPVGDPAFYGYNFFRWTIRLSYNYSLAANAQPWVVDQTFEVLLDDVSGAYHVFRININPTENTTQLLNPTVTPTNPAGYTTNLPGQYLVAASPGALGAPLPRFVLDGRWLHAFNGPGRTTNAVYGNFRFNQAYGGGPNAVGMDEDYDAADLENWFLALQSADGKVMIPSFHRPAAIRQQYDPGTGAVIVDDWKRDADTSFAPLSTWTWGDSASRILRPVAADGHDSNTFPDLVPDLNGKINYDVDNDGDGMTDSVWVDLGYPPRRNAQGQLYKPLFAFMVIGLNGRIPLNTAGNLGGRGGSSHAAHLGNSVSEVDPTYGLQNAYNIATDLVGAYTPPFLDTMLNVLNSNSLNSQVDSGNVDVRLTQLRNLLAGTRPQPNPVPSTFAGFPQPASISPMLTDPLGATNGDDNFVAFNNGQVYFMPNGQAENAPIDIPVSTGPNEVVRVTTPVPGRWGEPQSIPGYGIINPFPPPNFFNFVGQNYNNQVRAGYSIDVSDIQSGNPRDGADDNYNSFDPFPPLAARLGEIGDIDFLDPAGAIFLPVERMRRFVTPVDVNGTGSIRQWNGLSNNAGPDLGGDTWGRVEYFSYFRPPGLPGQVAPGTGTTAINFPWTTGQNYPTTFVSNIVPPAPATSSILNNTNPLHGFEAHRFPNLRYGGGGSLRNPQRAGGAPVDLNPNPNYNYLPGTLPSYDVRSNARINSDGLNEADEMNLYQPNPQVDSPYGFSDLEWLYRKHDVDGVSLHSRLAQLAPISFTNTVDGMRRRRLYALDSWELNNYAWTNDNPANVFPNNSRFAVGVNAGYTAAGLPAPSLVQRDKKINLNFPLPVSNDPNEAVRQKWITETYMTLKAVLPPLAVDSAEELAQLSQYVINIVDFRDPDATMTHWRNPDVMLRPGTPTSSPYLVKAPGLGTDIPLDQYGMEYNPIAINEVLAYSFKRKRGGVSTPSPRFFMELVNTLTSPELGTLAAPGLGTGLSNASVLDLAGFQSVGALTPWDGGCWDVVFTADDPLSRPDPVLGQLQPGGTYYGLMPLVQATFNPAPTVPPSTPPPTPPAPLAGDPLIFPLPQAPGVGAANPLTAATMFTGAAPAYPAAPYYFLTIGNPLPASDNPPTEATPFGPTYELNTAWDPVDYTTPASANPLPAGGGVLPPTTVTGPPPLTYPGKLPSTVPTSTAGAAYYWVCLRRPANPFAPVTAANPMIVVDCMRFPYIEGGGTGTVGSPDTATLGGNRLYSYQRLQPFRGGQAVPLPGGPAGSIDPRYGYSEQVAAPVTDSGNYGKFGTATTHITQNYYHTLGWPNDGGFAFQPTGALTATTTATLLEPWDYFPFNDRDFTSVAELLMVPGCPPGLFTKQFAEFAPSAANVTTIFGNVRPQTTPALTLPVAYTNATMPFSALPLPPPGAPAVPHTFPYLVDKFFYTASSPAAVPPTPVFGDTTGDGWFKMFEFFEVPSQMIGAVDAVAKGTNFDWMRQDTKPGLLNLNLIIDEEVFFSVFGQQDGNFRQQLLNFHQLPLTTFMGSRWIYQGDAATPLPLTAGAGISPIPLVVTATNAYGAPAAAYPMTNVGVLDADPVMGLNNTMKGAFAQFLSIRHGGSGFVFGYGSGLPGQSAALYTNNPNAPVANFLTSPIPADRPFHSLSYPDIDYTLMRPAALPPSAFTDPIANLPASFVWPPAYTPGAPGPPPTNYTGDPGIRNRSLYQGFLTGANATPPGSTPQSTPATTGAGTTPFLLPPAIPARRLFQPPDANPVSNAGDTGDQYQNYLVPTAATAYTGALPLVTVPPPANYTVNLYWPLGATLPGGVSNPYLGANSGAGPPPTYDFKQHPYFRTEALQKAMNLTTVRTHQYAVWITVGFFEVLRQGDPDMAGYGMNTAAAALAFDILGPELGASSGQTTRYRGFFIVDRLQLHKFDPNTPDNFRPAVVYRQAIE